MNTETSRADNELRQLFSEPVGSVKAREAGLFDEITRQYSRLVLHGAGNLGRKVLAGLRKIGKTPLAFTENNPRLWGTAIEGVPVMAPGEAAEKFADIASFVICIWTMGADRKHASITDRLKAAGCKSVVSFIPLFWKYPELFLPHCRLDSPHKAWEAEELIRKTFGLLNDEHSRMEYIQQLKWVIAPEVIALPIENPVDELCFPKGLFTPANDEVFVDCGAYDGDTLRNFLAATHGQFGFAYCFEPDPLNFKKLQHFVATLSPAQAARISMQPAAVAEKKMTVRLEPTGMISSMISEFGTLEVPCVRLDDTVRHTPTYIQMDVEGFEPNALQGAEQMIRHHSPRLAIRLYHIQSHLWSLPLQIADYSNNYRFYIRRHGDEFGDVVLYALPKV